MKNRIRLLARAGMIRFDQPAAPAGGGDPAGTPPAAPEGGTPPATPPAAPTPTPPAAPAEWDGNVESLPKGAQDLIRGLRNENATRRANSDAAQKEAITAMAKAFGIPVPDGEDAPTTEQLAAQVTQAQAAQKQAAIELAVYQTATQHGGNPAALTDSRAFLAKVADLDPTAEDFTTKVTAAAKDAVTANQTLKAVQGAGTSSVEHPGGTGEPKTKPSTLTEAIGAHYGTK